MVKASRLSFWSSLRALRPSNDGRRPCKPLPGGDRSGFPMRVRPQRPTCAPFVTEERPIEQTVQRSEGRDEAFGAQQSIEGLRGGAQDSERRRSPYFFVFSRAPEPRERDTRSRGLAVAITPR